MASLVSTIMFGSIECKLEAPAIAPTIMKCEEPRTKAIDSYAKLEEQLSVRLEKARYAQCVMKRNGTCYLKYPTAQKLKALKKKEALIKAEEFRFQNSPPTIVSTISIAGGPMPAMMEDEDFGVRRPLHKTPSSKKRIIYKPVLCNETSLSELVRRVKVAMSTKGGSVEIVDKRQTRLSYKFKGRVKRAVVHVRHMDGKRGKVDFSCSDWTSKQMKILAKVDVWSCHMNSRNLQPGDSGTILNASRLTGKVGRHWDDMFIVRGSHEGKVYDARSKVTEAVAFKMIHYTHADDFWAGLDGNWAKYRGSTSHVCTPDYSVIDCGKVAAILTQGIMPIFKITCSKCAKCITDLSFVEFVNLLNGATHEGMKRLEADAPAFMHARELLKVIRRLTTQPKTQLGTFDEIRKLVGERTTSPFTHLNVLNEFFLRGLENGPEEWLKAQDSLFELTRFQKNRTDNIKKGDIASFRNKLSGKAHWNLYLSCDNQLDKNANFLWGQREYHAKRFFSNFFEEIEPSKGYASYELRKFPNGTRKLAIGNLIVPLDLAEFRRRMKGEFVKQPETSKKCISLLNGNFVYPCCCTTLDDGSAVESTFYHPTQKHMVIGNSGDQKYVDLPSGNSEMLYMTKEGYCYINLYLAMLVNVNEDDAKDFTKKVRDMCVPKLGKWPTLLDVATTCAQLRAFYPDVHDAELPRILVDHNTQTCHVVDSFGSATSGYHILKAATVSQLILFANDELESDIKHYKVGGIPNHCNDLSDGLSFDSGARFDEFKALKVLVKGIYRPKVMKQLLLDEPYIMLLSVVSPGILMAMFNSGSFELAVNLWINEKQSLAMIATMLSSLSLKVSLADTLISQHRIIESAASDLLSVACDGFKMYLTYETALTLLQKLKFKHESDAPLITGSFLSYDEKVVSLVEKSYLALLTEAWSDLTWLEKLRATWWSRRAQRDFSKPLHPRGQADMKGLYDISPKAHFSRSVDRLKKGKESLFRRISDYKTSCATSFVSFVVNKCIRNLPSLINTVNTLVLSGLFINVVYTMQAIILDSRRHKAQLEQMRVESNEKACVELYYSLQAKLGKEFTWEEYINYLKTVNPALVQFASDQMELHSVKHQKATPEVKNLEQIVAFITLVIMMFDPERSDCVFKTLNKLKGAVGTLDYDVRHQSLDDIVQNFDDRNQVVQFELDDEVSQQPTVGEITFSDWWNKQIEKGFVLPHYRTEGQFMEFTRSTATQVANDISQSIHTDFLIRGAVGSGKSTGLPTELSKMGSVLLLEPTRPLAENVHKQLSGAPFFQKPTLRMRGSSVFGSSPISIMTSGFALHFFANNRRQLEDFEYVIFDECHVLDASAMAFRSLLSVYHKRCKVLKVSATPPGREVEFTTQFPVKLIVEESLSFSNFVEAQRTKSNADVLQYGNNILVYVASYNEVDNLSKLLTDKGMMVTKVDGRTMKHGSLEIVTKGTAARPHFVVATNIIENGVTLDIDVVVDFGIKVAPFLDIDNRSVSYEKVSISYGERIQRLGRVGRLKNGVALRIGSTVKGLVEIPSMIATEAALACFAYNLPVMAAGVSVSLVSKCTVRQVRTMQQFELNPFFMYNFVAHDGTMHPAIHDLLKKYKLRDSSTPMCEQSIPYRASGAWLTVAEYERTGVQMEIPRETKVAFHIKDVPAKLHEELWRVVLKFKDVCFFPTIKSASISKIAYTLSTDLYALQRTLTIIESLIEEERAKQSQFKSYIDSGCSSMFSIVNLTSVLRSKYAKDYTLENIQKLEKVKSQLQEFSNLRGSTDEKNLIQRYEALQFVHHQSKNELAKSMRLKGIWCKSLIVKDAIIACGVAVGGVCLLYSWFTQAYSSVHHQGKTKSKRIQALKFRKARDKRAGFEIDNNEDTIEEYFGSAYTKKGKGKGTQIGMGKTNRKFISMYGFEPGEYSYIQFVDPLTGAQLEENIYADIYDVQDKFGKIRNEMYLDEKLERDHLAQNNIIHAYFRKDWSDKALKVDLSPHNPLRVNEKSSGIAKFPEREGELRQTGKPVVVDVSEIPAVEVAHESKALMRGLRDYNSIAQTICELKATTETGACKMYGIGFGAYIISNHHLFKSFNGHLEIRSHHGVFRVPNMMQLQVKPITGRDMIIIKMPKDFPVFPQRIHFRDPEATERICIVGTNFQTKSLSSTVTETSATYSVPRSTFWKHWISTDDGHCGLPVVSTKDGNIIGIHSLANNRNSENYYSAFDEKFEQEYLRNVEHTDWVKNWKYNPDTVAWGPLKLTQSAPSGLFKTTKLIEDLMEYDEVREQGINSAWMLNALEDNLKAVAYMKNQLVTKHVVKGECVHFARYLAENKEARDYFTPLMNEYGKSLLNKEAYIKDIMKYSKPIEVGVVDCDAFEEAVNRVILYMQQKGFRQCSFITDEQIIFKALNMNAAVGALYGGKKKDYFEKFSDEDKANILMQSCLRLYKGDLGVWNGSLKAELRCKEKILANKTRTFTAAPLDTLLGGKTCVDDFNNQFYSKNIECCWTVGMTKFYGGWDRLLRNLPDGWIYCDADGSQFDSSLTPYLINAVLAIRSYYMEDWDVGQQMLKNLYTEIIYTPIATPDGTIVKKFRGNNSGQPSTVVDNSLMVVLAMHYAFVKENLPYDEVENFIKFYVNGDDLIIAVHPSKENVLDRLASHFSSLGLNYDFTSRTRDKSELWFMSHRGIEIEGMYVPKLEEERIVSILQWDRATKPEYRLEAVCAAMIEAWGYPHLIHQIRKFYSWLIEQHPFSELAAEGKAPYIAEMALRRLYLDRAVENSELQDFMKYFTDLDDDIECEQYEVHHQAGEEFDATQAGGNTQKPKKNVASPQQEDRGNGAGSSGGNQQIVSDRDVNAATKGTHMVPRIKTITSKMNFPKANKKNALNLDHLLEYKPRQIDLSNTRATQMQFDTWFNAVQAAYELEENQMSTVMNGLMVWCIENGTSPNINGVWVMMDGEEQVEYPLKPVIENAKPTFRQIMAHFSDVAEAYIEMRNKTEPYMPRYGLVRNLRDMSLARYAFDFYEMTSRTSTRAREAHIQMKAAALKSSQSRLFGLDGGISTQEENTERHTTEDVNPNMHTLLGVRNM
nr:polyprotein [Amaranthus leaf mottle virus]